VGVPELSSRNCKVTDRVSKDLNEVNNFLVEVRVVLSINVDAQALEDNAKEYDPAKEE